MITTPIIRIEYVTLLLCLTGHRLDYVLCSHNLFLHLSDIAYKYLHYAYIF